MRTRIKPYLCLRKGNLAVKKNRILRSMSEYIIDNKIYYLLAASAVFVGIVIGSISEITMASDAYENLNTYIDNFLSAYSIQPVNKAEIFKTSFYSNVKVILFLWISGLWVGFIPFAILHMGIKGYKLGFSIAFFVQAYKGKGVIFALFSLLPQIFILIPALMVYAVFNMKYAISIHHLGDRKNILSLKKEMYLRNLVCIIGMVIIVLICSFMDSFVIASLLKPICYFFNR